MILRKLSIFGFKSFADKTELQFGEGMTAVIGPNGCGKSNVVDAIRWVFGEQKASMLRSANMQDVIFSGTQKRQPLNMAEVTLTIENNKRVLPVEYSEVAITRRIHRSGESEYRLNKVPCRLRDIQNLFLDTGVGSSAYTTIENKMIEKILSDKAEERRTLFEEAAGIGKYKQLRKESLGKLEKTRQDLLRINDKVIEADRMVSSLGRQVEKAKRYKNYYDELKTLEIGFENHRYIALTDAMKKRQAFLSEQENKRELLRANMAASESRIEKMQLSALEKEKDLEIASRNVAEANEKIIRIDRDASVAAERLNNLRQNTSRFEQDAAQFDKRVEEAALMRAQIEKSVVAREAQLLESSVTVDGASAELARFDERLNASKQHAEQLGRDQIENVNLLGEAKNRLNSVNSNLNSAIERKERDEREIAALEERSEEYQDAIESCRKQLNEVDCANRGLMQAREVLLGRIEKEEERYRGLVEEEKRLEAQIASNKSQLKFLAGLDAAFEGYEAGVKALLKAQLGGLRGIAADLISVTDSDKLPLIEKVIGSAIQTVVFDTDEQVLAAVGFLRNEKAGAARIVSLERLDKSSSIFPERIEGITYVRSLVKTAEGCNALADHLFGLTAIAPNYSEAQSAANSLGLHSTVISMADGVVCLGDGSIIAGEAKKEQAGILQRKQQIEKLTVDIEQFHKSYEKILTEKDGCAVNRDEAKVELIDIDEQINRGQREQQNQQTTIRHYENETQNIMQRLDTLTPQLCTLGVRIAELRGSIGAIEAEAAVLEGRRGTLEEQAALAREGVRVMEEERKELVDHLKNIEIEVVGLKNRIANDKRDIEQLANDIKLFGESKLAKIEEKQKCLAEIADIESSQTRRAQELEAAKAGKTELENVRDLIREDYNGRLNEIGESRKEIKLTNNELEEAANLVHDSELKQTRDEQERRRIRERIWEAYELDLDGAAQEEIAVIDEDDEAVLKNISMYKERIKHVGQVNMAALEEYETENSRLTELTAQRDDLSAAVDELEKAVTKLDKEARAQFLSTFEQVQKNFTEMFTTLFEGGEANIALDETVDPLEAPIHINVRPGGKKMRGVQLLSGGERALTAISLLFALYLVKPSAYCILDELDAPLDDANIGRFVRVLAKFAEKTQFIIITHNKRTMEAADLLYGVTQQESGVSTIVSVKFDDPALKAA
ncbi:MAG: chromosome segregation protein SMC [Chitinispirillales bacterium]|jgi:chromosome segregation protein|nr:chromosome segregation protein SMC [Chitinispirillales bacterium]